MLQNTILPPLPTHPQKPQTQTNPQKQRGVMHNDQLKGYNKFPDCLPLVVSGVDFEQVMAYLFPFHYSR